MQRKHPVRGVHGLREPKPVAAGAALTDLTDLAFMGTIVSAGEAVAVVYATGKDAQFGRIAAGLGERQPERTSRPVCASSPTCCCAWRSC